MKDALLAEKLIALTGSFVEEIEQITFSPERKWIYNPLKYAWEPHKAYLERYGASKKNVLFLGMNPGPWGMAQTGVPFGEIPSVRDWMGIEETVQQPGKEHPKRPVAGFACNRSEVSGRRLWGLMQERFSSPENFFSTHFVANYCPLVFMEDSGKNLTPDKLSKPERAPLDAACDNYLKSIIELLEPAYLVGVGKYAEKKLQMVAESISTEETGSIQENYRVLSIIHPSPASPAANKGWAQIVTSQLVEAGVWSA